MFGIDDAALAATAAAGLSYLGTMSTNDANIDQANVNNAWSAQQYATRYQTMTKDMQAAGLNPMLAYTQSAGSAPTAQQIQLQNPVSSAVDSYNATRSGAARAAHDYASAGQADANVSLINSNAKKVEEEIKNIPEEGKRLRQMVQTLADQAALASQRGETEVQIRKQIHATVAKLNADTDLLRLDAEAARSLDNLGRTSKELKPIVDMLRVFFRH